MVLNSSQLYALTTQLDLCITSPNKADDSVVAVSNQVSGPIEPVGFTTRAPILEPRRDLNKARASQLFIVEITQSNGRTVDDQFSNSSDGGETVGIVDHRDPCYLQWDCQYYPSGISSQCFGFGGHGFSYCARVKKAYRIPRWCFINGVISSWSSHTCNAFGRGWPYQICREALPF